MSIAIGWHLYTLTKDPLPLGLIGLVEAIPAIGFAFVSGTIVDSHNPKRVMLYAQLGLLINAILLFLSIYNAPILGRTLEISALYTAIFISGAARSFIPPANFAMLTELVSEAQIPAAAAWNSSSVQIASIVGPSVAGLVFAMLGARTAFALPMFALVFALFFCARIHFQFDRSKVKNIGESFWSRMQGGIHFVFSKKLLLAVMSLDMFSVLFGGVSAILPVYADQILHVGPNGLGYLRSALSLGSVLTTMALAFYPFYSARGRLLLIVVAGYGLCNLGLAFSNNFILAFIFLFLSGVFDGVSMITRSMLLQFLTPQTMRGRVSAINSIFITSSNEIGAFESGVAAKAMGLAPSIVFGSVMTVLVVIVTWMKVPSLSTAKISKIEE
jgi:predicted MFS family arabinose efflux permease